MSRVIDIFSRREIDQDFNGGSDSDKCRLIEYMIRICRSHLNYSLALTKPFF